MKRQLEVHQQAQASFAFGKSAAGGSVLALALRDWTGSETIGHIAGWEGFVCGSSAIYLAMAEVLNEKFGRVVLPVGGTEQESRGVNIEDEPADRPILSILLAYSLQS